MNFQDATFMSRAIKLAEKGRYTTDPNPRVGCVLVKEGKVISEGWHMKAGEAHAEIVALSKLDNAKGATAYVTLEPCSHVGKTGPCCDALIAAGVKRVVISMQDPNPLVAGRGIKAMQDAGLIVESGILQIDAEALNKGYIKRMTTGLPYVRSKLAMSLDGRTAMASGESQWITSPDSRADVQLIRAENSVIMTGINTVLADDPGLNVRDVKIVNQPIRVVLDSQLQIPESAKLLTLPGITWVLTGSQNEQKINQLTSDQVSVFNIKCKDNKLDLEAVMIFLGQQQINTVLVEAGAILNGALMAENRIDEYLIYMAPSILGDQGRGLFHIPALEKMKDRKKLIRVSVIPVGSDLKMIYKIQ